MKHLPALRDEFTIDGPYGKHLCLVMELLGESVARYRRRANPISEEALPPAPRSPVNYIQRILHGLGWGQPAEGSTREFSSPSFR
jgi:hypothetical protein